jgi:hypothetical protein
MKQERKENTTQATELLSRGEAIKKLGGYAALTALGTFMILNPQKAQAVSPPGTGGGGGFTCTDGNPDTCCPQCYDGLARTECPSNECAGSIDSNGDCSTEPGCPPTPEPFQGNDNTTTKFNFESKYKSKYTKK